MVKLTNDHRMQFVNQILIEGTNFNVMSNTYEKFLVKQAKYIYREGAKYDKHIAKSKEKFLKKIGNSETFEKTFSMYYIHSPQILFNSLFISNFSLFESTFNKISSIAQTFGKNVNEYDRKVLSDAFWNNNFKQDFNRIKDYRKYITNDLKVDLTLFNAEWNSILGYQDIRNHIVHHNSFISQEEIIKKTALYKLINKNKKIALNLYSGHFYIVDHTFILDFISTSSKFLESVIDALKEKYETFEAKVS